VIHFNYLKQYHSPPEETLSRSSQLLGGQVQRKPVDLGEVETLLEIVARCKVHQLTLGRLSWNGQKFLLA